MKGNLVLETSRLLVTSALPYANGDIHLGHLAGAYLPADIHVRFQRMLGAEVIYVSGSDEHGVPITVSAEENGVTPQEVVDKYHAANEKAFSAAGIDFDIYGRTSCPRHHELTKQFFLRLLEKGYMEKRSMKQQYCPHCRRFLPDRYVEGTCPHCGAGGARGDQCDACGKLIDAVALVQPMCKICGDVPEVRKTSHWFLLLDKFEGKLRSWLDSHPEWRPNVQRFARGWLDEGLKPRAITRDLDWGVPVPLKDGAGKVIYVWFDAPIGYLTFTQQLFDERDESDRWKDFWCDPSCRILNFIGKDNIPFHATIWPAMLMGVEDDYILADAVVANEFLNFGTGENGGEKFSKSRGITLPVGKFCETFGQDETRYYLAACAPESSDSTFTWKDFKQRVDSELNDALGNFIHRTTSFVTRYFSGRVPGAGTPGMLERQVSDAIEITRERTAELLEDFRVRDAIAEVMALARKANRYFDETQPWVTRKSDMDACARSLNTCLALSRSLARLMRPFMPEASKRILRVLGEWAEQDADAWDSIGTHPPPEGGTLRELVPPFKKMDVGEFDAAKAPF